MRLTIATGRSSGEPEVHATGCGDVARGLMSGKYGHAYDFDVATVERAAVEWWSDFIASGEMTEAGAIASTRFLPCTRRGAR